MEDRKKIVQILLPAAAAAGVVLLIGALIATSDWNTASTATKGSGGSPLVAGPNDSGMTDTAPPVDAPEWKPRPSGLKVWEVAEGEGPVCPAGAVVTIHYTGWLTDGTKFDSSRDRGQPATFPLGDLVKGWQEGIPGMKPGGIRRLLVPSDLGYGPGGRPPVIPGGATLVFEVKLIDFK